MNTAKLVSLALALFLFINCATEEPILNEPEDPIKETYFTLNVLGSRNADAEEEWIIIHDENGNLLDFKKFEIGDNLKFETAPEEITKNIYVTEFQSGAMSTGSKGKEYLITTKKIPKGTVWSFGTDQEVYVTPPTVGSFPVTIEDIPGLGQIYISNERNHLYNEQPYSEVLQDFTQVIPLYAGEANYFISIMDAENNLKYYDFSNSVGEPITINYSQFKDFDHYVEIDRPENDLFLSTVVAFEDNIPYSSFNGYWIQNQALGFDVPYVLPFKFGYLNKFEKYQTGIFTIMHDRYNYSFSQYGKRLEQLDIPPKPTLIITDASFNTFKFTADIDFLSSQQEWRYDEGNWDTDNFRRINWKYGVPKGEDLFIGALPDEILSAYPEISKERFTYHATKLNLAPLDPSAITESHFIEVIF